MNSISLARSMRISSLEMVAQAKASHIASALSICDILSVLYSDIMCFSPSQPQKIDRDRFILSKGHACVALYAALADKGFFDKSLLASYGQDFSIFMNHVSHYVPGVEFSTGSLGHGLPFSVGKAKIAKFTGAQWKTFVLLSDGELDGGSNWEAFMFAGHHQLDNLIAIIDYNKLQSLTSTDQTLTLEPLVDKLQSFNWATLRVDGHNHHALKETFSIAQKLNGKPVVIIADTIKGKGVSFMENRVEWHYKSPNVDELKLALKEIKNA